MIPEIDSELGISVFSTHFMGSGGKIRLEDGDFLVSEKLSEKIMSLMSEQDGYSVYKLSKNKIDTNHALKNIFKKTGRQLKSLGLKDAPPSSAADLRSAAPAPSLWMVSPYVPASCLYRLFKVKFARSMGLAPLTDRTRCKRHSSPKKLANASTASVVGSCHQWPCWSRIHSAAKVKFAKRCAG